MKVKVIDSGSKANCYILKDSAGNQIILDCGVKCEQILLELDFEKPIKCLVSHKHLDHSLSMIKLIKGGISVYDDSKLFVGEQVTLDKSFVIMPIPAYHSVPNLGFIIYSKVDNKKILFITDTEKIPTISDVPFDLMMIECNYSIEHVQQNADTLTNKGFLGHLSMEYLLRWLETRQYKPKTLCLIHLSNSGNLPLEGLTGRFNGLSENIYIAKRNLEIEF